MAEPTISISSPTEGSTVGTTFDVSGTCTQSHEVTVTIVDTTFSNNVTPSNGNWSTRFSGVPVNTYSIEAKCGSPTVSTTVNDITVE